MQMKKVRAYCASERRPCPRAYACSRPVAIWSGWQAAGAGIACAVRCSAAQTERPAGHAHNHSVCSLFVYQMVCTDGMVVEAANPVNAAAAEWGPWAMCPSGQRVSGIAVKVQEASGPGFAGDADDTVRHFAPLLLSPTSLHMWRVQLTMLPPLLPAGVVFVSVERCTSDRCLLNISDGLLQSRFCWNGLPTLECESHRLCPIPYADVE